MSYKDMFDRCSLMKALKASTRLCPSELNAKRTNMIIARVPNTTVAGQTNGCTTVPAAAANIAQAKLAHAAIYESLMSQSLRRRVTI